ncbi:MAG TPA: 16S rRNA (adenine(1518)-N(6)/adenine(1519)-N(6))-dimethyltransferase RsmA [Candidatus Ligilactobacillus excrementigallinarum]|uniref:Ribosomal RNA small subunit methyltransferase A n=1 Tax=Candidatus Ligilactobacillus excrementigallinarum TaxID=2838641 RepID=A0A9D1UXM5_9LACO|nr:16S rRNA (adenine(1518)-N(6)/adenine(1519)-N(6))-dimethyltransferase RsmA [Candidatus Ligilactobacillus excrementigallinarum]
MANEIEIANPTRTRAIMETYGLNFKKSLGQNFLTDINVLHKIVDAAEITLEDDVIEVGPGIGALTEQLAKRAHQVMALEIDERLIPVLDETLAPYSNVTVLQQDVLKADLQKLIAENFDGQHHLKLVANLPYYITTPIIMHLLESPVQLDAIVVMMQKEVAQRLTAQPKTKDYGSLSIAVQYYTDAEIAFIVPKTVFVPQPKIDSAVVKLTSKKPIKQPQDEQQFMRLVKGSFAHRRKTLWNNLQGIYGKDAETKAKLEKGLAEVGIAKTIRPEALTISDFIDLANALIEFN